MEIILQGSLLLARLDLMSTRLRENTCVSTENQSAIRFTLPIS